MSYGVQELSDMYIYIMLCNVELATTALKAQSVIQM